MEKETWEKELLKLPEELRVKLAEYLAQTFLEGVEEGKKQRDKAVK